MFNAKKLTIALAVPALLGLAFVTAESGDYKKSSGSSSCSGAKQTSGASCTAAKASVKQASANGASCSGAQKASASCTGAKASASCTGANGAVKQASAGSGCCAGGAKASMAGACGTASKCGVSFVQAEDGLRIYALGNEASMKEWLETVATDLRENRNLNVEIFEAKGGSYMLVNSTPAGADSYKQLLQATAGDHKCMAICAANGCPPKA